MARSDHYPLAEPVPVPVPAGLPGPHRKSITHSGKAVAEAFITHCGKAVAAAFITHSGKAVAEAFITHSCIRLLLNARAALALRSGLYHICALSHGRNELLLAVSAASEPLAYLMVSAGAGAGAAAGAAGRSTGHCQSGCPCSRRCGRTQHRALPERLPVQQRRRRVLEQAGHGSGIALVDHKARAHLMWRPGRIFGLAVIILEE